MKFTIREVLLTTAIVALAIGWWIDRTRLARLPPPAIAEQYELVSSGRDGSTFYLCNPRTGEILERYSSGKWVNHTWTVADSKK